jgi:DNA-binding IclR family transcriptional regulator
MPAAPTLTVKSADRVLDLLELLCSSGRPMTHAEIAIALSIPKSSLSQLLANLAARHYLVFREGPNVYELGPAIAALAEGTKSNSHLLQIAQNVVDVLSRSTEETASFYRLRGTEVERMTVTNAQRPLRYWMQVGETMPVYATSGGKAILAALEPAERERLISGLQIAKLTPHTITSRSALRRELQEIQRAGIAYSRGEFEEGVIGISVAVLRPDRRPEGSLSVVLPNVRNGADHRKAIVEALLIAKTRLETEIGRLGKQSGIGRKRAHGNVTAPRRIR